MSKTGLLSILISDLCHIGCATKCFLFSMTSTKLTSDHVSSSSLVKILFTGIVLEQSVLFRLHLKIKSPPSLARSSLKNSSYFPRFEASRYFLIQVDFSDLLNSDRSIILRPPLS